MSAPPPQEIPYLDYQLRWHAAHARPGKHASRAAGTGGDYAGMCPFWQAPDARRIDLRRSMADPFGAVMVRRTEHRASADVVVAIDVSASMQPDPARSGLAQALRVARAAARSALRGGDGFGVLAFNGEPRPELSLPVTRARGAVQVALDRLAAARLAGRSAKGIERLAAHLPARRCLLLLVSDFLVPADLLERAFTSLARHDIAAIAIGHDTADVLPGAGLVHLRDPETGAARLVLARPALARRWRAAEAGRRAALDTLCLRHGRPAFHAASPIDLSALSEHLLAG